MDIEAFFLAHFFDRKIHTSYFLGISNQSVKICYILLEMSCKVLKVVKIESCQNLRLPKMKIAKIAKIYSCQVAKL